MSRVQGGIVVLILLMGTHVRAGEELSTSEAMEVARTARASVFESRTYAFCHDKNYGRDGTLGVEFCPLFDADTDLVCPEARESCPGWTLLEDASPRRRVLERGNTLRLPKIPMGLAQVLLAGVMTALVLIGLRAVGRLGRRPWRPGQTEVLTEDAEYLTQLPAAQAQHLLLSSRQSLAMDRPEQAARLLHLALLRHLDARGFIRFHASRTNGDYVRGLRTHLEMQALFRAVAHQTERLRFGDGRVDAEAVAVLLSEAERAVAGTKSRGPGSGIAILVALLALPQSGCDMGSSRAYRFHGPTGLSALPALLEAAGLEIQVGDHELSELLGEAVVVVRTAAPPEDLQSGALYELLASDTDVVVIDDGWDAQDFLPVTPILAEPGLVERVKPSGVADDRSRPWAAALALAREEHVLVPRARRFRLEESAEWSSALSTRAVAHPLLEPEGGPPVAATIEPVDDAGSTPGSAIVFADRDIFTNASLTRASNAALVVGFFRSLVPSGESVHLVDGFEIYGSGGLWGGGNGVYDSAGMLGGVTASRLLPLLLQILIFLLMAFGWMGLAFGTLRDPKPAPRKAFVEHTDALGGLYAKAGIQGRRYAMRLLAQWLVHIHRDRVRSGGWDSLSEELAEEHGLRPADVRAAFHWGQGDTMDDDPHPGLVAAVSTLAAADHRRR